MNSLTKHEQLTTLIAGIVWTVSSVMLARIVGEILAGALWGLSLYLPMIVGLVLSSVVLSIVGDKVSRRTGHGFDAGLHFMTWTAGPIGWAMHVRGYDRQAQIARLRVLETVEGAAAA